MQRKPSKSTRGQSAAEKRFASWVKEQPCIVCGCESGSIVDHVKGSAYKCRDGVVSVLVGMWYLVPLCQQCDQVKTQGSHRAFLLKFGKPQGFYWLDLVINYPKLFEIPKAVRRALVDDICMSLNDHPQVDIVLDGTND